MDTAIVLSGGDGAPSSPLPSASLVVAADSGLALAEALRLDVDLIVGDMDSVDLDLLAAYEAAGVAVERHPVDKDASDLELALHAAIERGADRIVVAGGGGGRLDHLLANAALLASLEDIDVSWFVGDDVAHVVRSSCVIPGSPGDIVSLLSVAGTPSVTTSGLRWRLNDEELETGSTRGISNEITFSPAKITVHGGALLAVHRSAR